MKSQVIFPTTIWTHELPELLPMLPAWRQRLDEMREREQQGQGRSTREGWSGPKTLFDDPDYKVLKAQSQQAFAHALRQMGVPEGFSFSMEAWANIHDMGGFNQPHIHREAVLSGCFYLHTPPGSGSIVFHDPRPGTMYSRPWGKGVNSWGKVSMQVRYGILLIFPHWLEHSVEPNQAAEGRYSIAMNAILPQRARKS